jgi:hypothetical protein
MDDSHGLHRPRSAQGPFNHVRFDNLSPWGLDANGLPAAPFNNRREPRAECPVHSDDDCLPWFDQIHYSGFQPGRTGSGDSDREAIRGLKDLAQQRLDIIHDCKKGGIEVA